MDEIRTKLLEMQGDRPQRDEFEAVAYAVAAVIAVMSDFPELHEAYEKMDPDHKARFVASLALNIRYEVSQ